MATGAGPAADWAGPGRRELGALAARGSGARPRCRQDPVEQWLGFAAAQAGRAVPHPDPEGLAAAAAPVPLRLALLHLEGLPLFQGERRNFEIRLGVTLFDAAAGGSGGGAFFGNTVFTPPVAYDMRKSRGKKGFHVDLNADVFFHTRAALPLAGEDARLFAVAEVVLVERTEEGVVAAEYSAGWAQVPLALAPPRPLQAYSPLAARGGSAASTPAASPTKRSAPASPFFAAAPGVQFATPHGGRCVPVFAGSPRYLLLRAALPEHAYPPQQLLADGAECRLHFSLEVYPDMEGWAPLLPEHFLVSYHDAVPGVQRLDAASGRPTTRFLGAASLLAEAALCAPRALLLCAPELRLPGGFLDVVRRALLVPPGAPPSPGPGSVHGGYAGQQSRAALQLRELQQCLRVRASVHNGRTFVGPTVWARPARLEAVPGHGGEHCLWLGEDLPLAWVPADVAVAVVLELVLLPASAAELEGPPGGPCEAVVLAWGAAVPFSQVAGGGEAAVAEGPTQVAMRSGPGHWVRSTPVLDWRRLLERTNRISPDPPLACFTLREVEGAAVWPPPAEPVALSLPRVPSVVRRLESTSQPAAGPLQRLPSGRAAAPAPQHSRHGSAAAVVPPLEEPAEEPSGRSSGGRKGGARQSVASEAETLHTVREGAASHEAPERKAKPALALPGAGTYKPLARAEAVRAWQINAHYDMQQPAGLMHSTSSGGPPAALLPVKTRLAPAAECSKGDAEALFAGSPMARCQQAQPAGAVTPGPSCAAGGPSAGCPGGDWWQPGSRGRAAVRVGDLGALAAAATPFAHTLARHVSLASELADPLGCDEVTLQFVGLVPAHGVSTEALGGRPGGRDTVLVSAPNGGLGQLHFTLRLFTNQPTVTAAAQLQPLPAVRGPGHHAGRLCALVPVGAAAGAGDSAGVSVTLALHSPEQLVQQLERLAAEEGLGEECRASAARQLRLQATRYLAERWLQVDVWDSTSLLQVGTFSLPLRGLLRQGQEVAEVVYECNLHDQATMTQRDGEAATLASAPLRGSILVRLLNRGRQGPLAGLLAGGGPAPAPRQLAAAALRGEVLVRAKPALEEAGAIMQELAGPRNGTASPRSLREEIVQRAQQKVQRILHYRHMSSPSGEGHGCAGAAGAAGEDLGRLVHGQLLADIEQARDRCKPDLILRRLQQELAAGVVLCAGPGEAAGFEREFINPSSHEEGWFEVCCSSPGDLALVADGQEWQALSEAAGHAGLLSAPSDGAPRHVITSTRFRLGPQQRAVLRFKWASCDISAEQEVATATATVHISRVQQERAGGNHSGSSSSSMAPLHQAPWQEHSAGCAAGGGNLRFPAQATRQPLPGASSSSSAVAQAAPLASFRVVVLQQPLVADRTLRLYHAAGPGGAAVSYAALFGALPAAERLVCGDLRVVCGPGMAATVMRGPSPHQPAGLLLSFPAPPSGASLRYQLAAFGGAGGASGGRGCAAAGGPLECWEVFVHSLPCLDLSAVGGETVTAERRVAAAAEGGSEGGPLQLSCHGLCRDELQMSPCELDLPPGAEGRLLLSYTPQAPGRRQALVSAVDDAKRRAVDMLLVRLDSTATHISRTFEVEVQRGRAVSKKVSYTNPYLEAQAFALRTTEPGLLRFAQPQLEVAGGASAQVRMTFDVGVAPPGMRSVLVFVDNVAERRVEECFRVVLRVC